MILFDSKYIDYEYKNSQETSTQTIFSRYHGGHLMNEITIQIDLLFDMVNDSNQ